MTENCPLGIYNNQQIFKKEMKKNADFKSCVPFIYKNNMG